MDAKDGIAKAKGISKVLNQYLIKKEEKNLTNFKQLGSIELLISRKQTHFSGCCPESIFDS
jgi:hypothetical protein